MPSAEGYWHIYSDTRSMITLLSGMTESELDDTATELEVDYEIFLTDYRGPYLADAYVGFAEMLRQWGALPWPATEGSALNGLTVAQFHLVWAWVENDLAKYCLGGKAIASGWIPQEAISAGVVAAISAAKSLFYAKSVLALGDDKMGQAAH